MKMLRINDRNGICLDDGGIKDCQVSFAATKFREILAQAGIAPKDASWQLRLEVSEELLPGNFKFALTASNRLTLSGDFEGLRCGLYRFLKILGFRYFNPSDGVMSPCLPLEIDLVGLCREYGHDFPYRCFHICGTPHYDEKAAFWMSFHELNRKISHLEEEPLFGKALDQFGLQRDTTVHSFSLMLPDDEYFNCHPEYFALIGGVRIRQSDGGQLCLSNPEMRSEFTANMLKYIKRYPNIKTFGICPNDGYGHCQCEQCLALDDEEDRQNGSIHCRIADFSRDIAARIGKLAPEILVGNFSYSNFSDFLLRRDDFPDNLSINFTQFRCYKHAIDDPECPVNAKHFRRLCEFRRRVEHINIYEYFIYNWDELPAPFLETIYRDVQAYRRLNLDGMYSEIMGAAHPSWKHFALLLSYTAELMTCSDLHYEDFLHDYCRTLFADNAENMFHYFLVQIHALQKMSGCLDKTHGATMLENLYTPTVLQAMSDCLSRCDFRNGTRFLESEKRKFEKFQKLIDERKKFRMDKKVVPGAWTIFESASWQHSSVPRLPFVERATMIPDKEAETWSEYYATNDRIGWRICCMEPDMRKLTADFNCNEINSKGFVYDRDCVEIFIAGSENLEECCHFLIDPYGNVAAAKCRGTSWNWSYQHHMQIHCFHEKDCWRLQVSLPRTDIAAGGDILFSLARNRYRNGDRIATGIPDGGAYFNIDGYLQA